KGHDKKYLLAKFKQQTYEAVEHRISVNPVLNSFQETVHHYNIDLDLVEAFFKSMEMDLKTNNHTSQSYQKYIYGSAEVIGLMCLYVFVESDDKLYEELKPYAGKLGAAFQKVNFLRDLREDYRQLGRVYFPHINMNDFSNSAKKQIEKILRRILIRHSLALKGYRQHPNAAFIWPILPIVPYLEK